MPTKTSFVDQWIGRYLEEETPRAKSLIVSVFGDSVAPYAPGVWLGELIELLAPLGVNERLVRTSVFRLVEENWLEAKRDGRRSHYSLTAEGTRRFEIAFAHVYAPPRQDWDGRWTVVLMPRGEETAQARAELRQALEWEGFAAPYPGVLLHPSANVAALKQEIDRLHLTGQVLVMRAEALEAFSVADTKALLARCWDLSQAEDRYRQFIARFQPLLKSLERTSLDPGQAFQLQALLIHSFRRAKLHDPGLPVPMLRDNWLGLRAYALCRELYGLTRGPSHRYLRSIAKFDASAHSVRRLSEQVEQRFGGLSHGAKEQR
jgi:phenylacetic acid degradation operon negative regulatory protein